MAFYRLMAGKSYGPDRDQEPDPVTGRYPSKKYVPGDIIESDVDLAKMHGESKFQLVEQGEGGRFRNVARAEGQALAPPQLNASASVAPSGQVSSGLQKTTTGPDGKAYSGIFQPKDEEEAQRLGAEPGSEKGTGAAVRSVGEARSPARSEARGEVRGEVQGKRENDPSAPAPINAPGAKRSVDHEYGNLEGLKVEELKELATAEEINLGGARTKEEMIKKIRSDFK